MKRWGPSLVSNCFLHAKVHHNGQQGMIQRIIFPCQSYNLAVAEEDDPVPSSVRMPGCHCLRTHAGSTTATTANHKLRSYLNKMCMIGWASKKLPGCHSIQTGGLQDCRGQLQPFPPLYRTVPRRYCCIGSSPSSVLGRSCRRARRNPFDHQQYCSIRTVSPSLLQTACRYV